MVAQVEVGDEQYRNARWQRLHHRHGVAGCAAVVCFSFHGRAAVHVRDHEPVGVIGPPGSHVFGSDGVGERAARVQIGNQDALVGIRDRGRLGHEVHPADDEDGRVELGGAARHLE